MPRRPRPSQRAYQAMREASRLCEKLGARKDVEAERDRLWHEAHEEGATYKMIADECGMSEATVHLRLSRYRGAAWAQQD